jgi:predicted AlkP superfamily phosphohydrolase/phosphomutase
MGAHPMKKKLYLIGLDSAALWVISGLYKKYDMKGFEYLIEKGMLVDLESTVPPVTAVAWPSIYSGKLPGEHEVMDFIHIDKNYTRQLIYYDPEQHRPFWEILAEKGFRSLVITPPMVLLRSKSKNVDMVTGWPLQPNYNSKRLEEIAKKFNFKGEPEIGVEMEKHTLPLKKATEQYKESMHTRAEMSKYLITKNDYDMAFVCFTETDRIQHYALNKQNWEEFLAPIYKEASDFIKWVVDYSKKKKEEAVILVVSDHGTQAVKNKFLTNTWLINNGYALLKSGKAKTKKNTYLHSANQYISEKIMKLKIRRAVYNKMPAFMKKAAEQFVNEGLEPSGEGDYLKMQETDLELGNTKVFSAVSYGPVGMMWINDSRFSKPAVKKDEVEKIKKEVMAKLEKVKTHDGKKLITRIIDGRKYYGSVKSFIAPDIMFELSEGNIVDFSYYSNNSIFMKPEASRSGDHATNGIFGCIDTNRIKVKINKKNLSVYDVYPYIMKYYNGK